MYNIPLNLGIDAICICTFMIACIICTTAECNSIGYSTASRAWLAVQILPVSSHAKKYHLPTWIAKLKLNWSQRRKGGAHQTKITQSAKSFPKIMNRRSLALCSPGPGLTKYVQPSVIAVYLVFFDCCNTIPQAI